MKVGKLTKTRILDIRSIKSTLIQKFHPEFCNALLSLHALTGSDSISSFVGIGKIKAINILMEYPEIVRFLVELGESWSVTEEMIDNIIEFVCTLYGKKTRDVNILRYQLFSAKDGKVDPDALPP